MIPERKELLRGPFEVTEDTRERKPSRYDLLTGQDVAAPAHFDRIIRTNRIVRKSPRKSTF